MQDQGSFVSAPLWVWGHNSRLLGWGEGGALQPGVQESLDLQEHMAWSSLGLGLKVLALVGLKVKFS